MLTCTPWGLDIETCVQIHIQIYTDTTHTDTHTHTQVSVKLGWWIHLWPPSSSLILLVIPPLCPPATPHSLGQPLMGLLMSINFHLLEPSELMALYGMDSLPVWLFVLFTTRNYVGIAPSCVRPCVLLSRSPLWGWSSCRHLPTGASLGHV